MRARREARLGGLAFGSRLELGLGPGGHCQPKIHASLIGGRLAGRMTQAKNPFRYFDSSPEVIGLVVMMYVRYLLSVRNVEDLPFERGIEICHETVRLWWNRFGRHCQRKFYTGLVGRPPAAATIDFRENRRRGRRASSPKMGYTHLL